MPDLSPYLNNLLGSLAAGAVGAGASHYFTRKLPTESDEEFAKRRALNTTVGGLGGAAVGAAAPEVMSVVNRMGGSDSSLNPINWVIGAADGLVGALGPLTVLGGAAGAYGGGRVANSAADKTSSGLQTKLDNAISEAKIPGGGTGAVGEVAGVKGEMAAHEAQIPGKVRGGRVVGGVGGATLGALLEHYMKGAF